MPKKATESASARTNTTRAARPRPAGGNLAAAAAAARQQTCAGGLVGQGEPEGSLGGCGSYFSQLFCGLRVQNWAAITVSLCN